MNDVEQSRAETVNLGEIWDETSPNQYIVVPSILGPQAPKHPQTLSKPTLRKSDLNEVADMQ